MIRPISLVIRLRTFLEIKSRYVIKSTNKNGYECIAFCVLLGLDSPYSISHFCSYLYLFIHHGPVRCYRKVIE